MAKPIKETPVLKGKDAENFMSRIKEQKKLSTEEYDKARKNYEEILRTAKI